MENLWIGVNNPHLSTLRTTTRHRLVFNFVRRIYPQPDTAVTVAEAYGVNRERHPSGRPWIGLCMVMSIDGSTVVKGNSQALSGPADLDVLVGLRQLADVIVVGASTIRQEGYGPPSKTGQKVGVVTRSGNLDLESELFRSGAGFLILPENTAIADTSVRCVRAGHGSVDLPAAMKQLEGTFVQLEGGPMLNAAMFAADLVDEINVTISPLIVGGGGPRLTEGAPELFMRHDIAHVIHDDGFLFVRYIRRTQQLS